MSTLYLFSKKITPSPVAILEVLTDKKAREDIEAIGGLEYISLLQQAEIPEGSLDIFIKKVKQSSMRKLVIEMCKDVQDTMLHPRVETMNPSEIVGMLEKKVIDLNTKNSISVEVHKMGEGLEERLKKRADNPNTIPGLETGMIQFDRYTLGGRPGDLIIVCARAKTGKSTLLQGWAIKFSIIDGLPILYIDTEMTSEEQEDRMIAHLSEVPHDEIVSGLYVVDTEHGSAKDKIERVNKAVQMIKDGQFYHVYMPHFSIEKVSSLTRQFQLQHGIVALFFDYIKMPSNQANSFAQMQEYQALGFFTSGIKDIGGLLKMPVYSACQENRNDPKSGKKDETNVGGSDRILQLATKLVFLWNKSEEDIAKEGILRGNQKLYIAFQRNGQSDCPPIDIMSYKSILKQVEV